MLKFGLILDQRNIDYLAREQVDLLLLPPGFALSENDVKQQCGVDAFSLNRLIEQGEMSPLSQRIAPFLRALLAAVENAPIEAVASQNDLYQYHLRYQYLFLSALERFLKDKSDYCVVLAAPGYRRYVSPMRPDLGLWYSNEKLLAYLAGRLVSALGGKVSMPARGLVGTMVDFVKLKARQAFLRVFVPAKLFQKVWRSRNNAGPASASSVAAGGKVGIIVRTDSEVIAASYLIAKLKARGTQYVVIHDEILSSTTTLARLTGLGIESVSIGSAAGLTGVWRALGRKPASMVVRSHMLGTFGDTETDAILFSDPAVRSELTHRLLDFAVPQSHFSAELTALARRHGLTTFVTFAFVDQWGPIIQNVGTALGIPTVAVQNAAQDPEEYPRLCWADHYCVESTYLKGRLVQLGYPSHKLTATGLPQLSAVEHAPTLSAEGAFAHKRILLLTQPAYKEHFERLIGACAQLCGCAGFELAIKFHPRQPDTDYKEAIAAARELAQVRLFQSESLDELIRTSSAAVSVVSTALVRAVNLGTPAVSFLPVEEKHLDLYYAQDSTVFCTPDIVAFETLISAALADYPSFYDAAMEKRRHYLNVHATFEPTNDSAENIVAVIAERSNGNLVRDSGPSNLLAESL
jgi:hypothetical protein